MPSIYAHNKFGKLVIASLPKETKQIIKKYPRAFRIGLQGPDFLFFYRSFYKNRINQLGVYYHHQDAYNFIRDALEVIGEFGTDSSQYSYILGFICHFALDNACHPYVSEAMKLTDCGHAEVEGDFDQLLLSVDGHRPETYPLFNLVPTDFDTALSIVPFYDGVSVYQVQSCLWWMKWMKKFFHAPGIVKRTLVDLLMRATLHYKKFNGHIILPTANKKCRKESEHLYELLKEAVPHTIYLIENFNHALQGDSLTGDFHRDFYGKHL